MSTDHDGDNGRAVCVGIVVAVVGADDEVFTDWACVINLSDVFLAYRKTDWTFI